MAYQNYNNYGWWSSPSNEQYQYEATPEPSYTSRQHHHKNKGGRVAFYDEPIVEEAYYPKEVRKAESETITERFQHASRFGDHSAFESVDQEADAFIQYEHERMELAQLMSMRAA